MTPALSFLAVLGLAQPPEMVTIKVFGRDMSGLRDQEVIYRGTCDSRPASAEIRRSTLTEPGRLVLRAGRWRRTLPATFLCGAALTSALHSIGLGCDGRRLQLHALAIRENAQGEFIMDIQNAFLDMRTGALSLDEMRTLSPSETRSENAPNR